MKKTPLWNLLVESGYFNDRKKAESWILAGKVLVGTTRVDKPGQLVVPDSEITIKGLDRKYVGRGGYKLEGALDDFAMDVSGVVALDAGAATGGFTDCLLQRGAARVYAVEADRGRLANKLRTDARVVPFEGTNIGDAALLNLSPRPTLGVVDLSCVRLETAVPLINGIMGGRGELVCLVKEFESASGRSLSPDGYQKTLCGLTEALGTLGYPTTGVTHSHILGNRGAVEFFVRVSLSGSDAQALSAVERGEQISTAVARAMSNCSFL